MIDNFVAVDIETTGLNPVTDKILEIGALKIENGNIVDTFSELVNPDMEIPERIIELTGINDEMVKNCPDISCVIKKFVEFCDKDVLLGHNLKFDYSFIVEKAAENGMKFKKNGLDTLTMAKRHLKDLDSRKLDYLCSYYGIKDEEHHRAFNDARVTVELYRILADLFEKDTDPVFVPLPMSYKIKKISPITQKQKSYLTDLIRYHRIKFEDDIDELTKSEASRWIDKILSSYGRII